MSRRGTVTINRFDEDDNLVATIEVNYAYSPGHPGCRYGDYPEPPSEESADVWPVDGAFELTAEEAEEAERLAIADYHGVREDAEIRRHEEAREAFWARAA